MSSLRPRSVPAGCILLALILCAGLSQPRFAAALGPELEVSSAQRPDTGLPLGGRLDLTLRVSNGGDASLDADPLELHVRLPAAIRAESVSDQLARSGGPPAWQCAIGAEGRSVDCLLDEELAQLHASAHPIGPGEEPCVAVYAVSCRPILSLAADAGASPPSTYTTRLEACGGGSAECAKARAGVTVVPHFELKGVDGGVFAFDGAPANRAGSHPDRASISFSLTQTAAADGLLYSTEDLRDQVIDLPPGLAVDPTAVPGCAEAELAAGGACPPESQVGVLALLLNGLYANGVETPVERFPIYKMRPPQGTAALFGVPAQGSSLYIAGRIHRDERVPGGYRLRMEALNAPQILPVAGSTVTLWGIPADARNDAARGAPSAAAPRPLLTLPTSCQGPQHTELAVRGWQGAIAGGEFLSHDDGAPPLPLGVDRCEEVGFAPKLRVRPTSELADSPTGLDLVLDLPRDEDPEGTATAELRRAVISLPEGLVLNPSAANGLAGCSAAEIDLRSEGPARCPEASLLGHVEAGTPMFAHSLPGSVYLAEPFHNPSGRLLALYLVIEDPRSGIAVKLPAGIDADPETGRLRVVLDQSPQLPFERVHVRLFEGLLRTPPRCGEYRTGSELTPWSAPASGPPATPGDTFAISAGSEAQGCGGQGGEGQSTTLRGGSLSTRAGASSAFVLHLVRPAGSPQLESVALRAPSGLSADLSEVRTCPERTLEAISSRPGGGAHELGAPACPRGSEIGRAEVGAGAGPRPYFLGGRLYLAGPHHGAPHSLAAVFPVLAGPFDLGSVVLRVAVEIDPRSARLHFRSDPLPEILAGIPLDLRELHLKLDRPGLFRNPTSCAPMRISGTATGPDGVSTPLVDRFQVGGCAALPFRPRIAVGLKGTLARNGRPSLRAVIGARPGQANIARTALTLPVTELLEYANLRAVCSRARYAAAGGGGERCPPRSRYGHARVSTPLLDRPLEGPLYLRSGSDPEELPDLVASLSGESTHLDFVAHLSSVHGLLHVAFVDLPDLPVRKVALQLQGGPRGLLVNTVDLCQARPHLSASFLAHNRKRRAFRPRVKLDCGGEGAPAAASPRRQLAGHRDDTPTWPSG